MEVVQSRQLKRSHVQEVVATQKSLAHAAVTQIAVQAKDRTEKEISETEAEAMHPKIRADQDHGKFIKNFLYKLFNKSYFKQRSFTLRG